MSNKNKGNIKIGYQNCKFTGVKKTTRLVSSESVMKSSHNFPYIPPNRQEPTMHRV